MFSPRAEILNHTRMDAKENLEIAVRAGSQAGAIVAARIQSSRLIPLKDQEVVAIENKDNSRFFNVWKVTVRDTKPINSRWI